MPVPDYNTVCAIEARLHEMARDLRMSYEELVEAIQHVQAFRDFRRARAEQHSASEARGGGETEGGSP